MGKVVNDKNEIIKPVVYGRSRRKYKERDYGYFRSGGWEISGIVQQVVEEDTFQGYIIYMIEDIKRLVWVGLEMTEEEQIEYDKNEVKRNQLKFKL